MNPKKVEEYIALHPKCDCPNLKCEQHGHCFECVMVHRHFGNHVPHCLQFMLRDKVKELAKVAEMRIAEEVPRQQKPV